MPFTNMQSSTPTVSYLNQSFHVNLLSPQFLPSSSSLPSSIPPPFLLSLSFQSPIGSVLTRPLRYRHHRLKQTGNTKQSSYHCNITLWDPWCIKFPQKFGPFPRNWRTTMHWNVVWTIFHFFLSELYLGYF